MKEVCVVEVSERKISEEKRDEVDMWWHREWIG
jgi:hypothetical protein